jgi:hypothetical protein
VHGNQVVTPAGLAFVAVVIGTTQILDNVFVSQRRRQQNPLVGRNEEASCIQIINIGDQDQLAGVMGIFFARVHLENVNRVSRALVRDMPDGRLMFNDNQVTLLFPEPGEEIDREPKFTSVLLSLGDISLQGNQFQTDLPLDQMPANVGVIGGTVRATGNNFRESLILGTRPSLSYFSRALFMNITSLNTAVNCIATCCNQAAYHIKENNLMGPGDQACAEWTNQLCPP